MTVNIPGFVMGLVGALLVAYGLGSTWPERALFAGLFIIVASTSFVL